MQGVGHSDETNLPPTGNIYNRNLYSEIEGVDRSASVKSAPSFHLHRAHSSISL